MGKVGRPLKPVKYPFVSLGVTNGSHRVKCGDCGSQFEAARMDTHQCKDVQLAKLFNEAITEHDGIEGKFKCGLCKCTFFSTASNAKKHLRLRYCPMLKDTSRAPAATEASMTIPQKKWYSATDTVVVLDTNILMHKMHCVESLLQRGIYLS